MLKENIITSRKICVQRNQIHRIANFRKTSSNLITWKSNKGNKADSFIFSISSFLAFFIFNFPFYIFLNPKFVVQVPHDSHGQEDQRELWAHGLRSLHTFSSLQGEKTNMLEKNNRSEYLNYFFKSVLNIMNLHRAIMFLPNTAQHNWAEISGVTPDLYSRNLGQDATQRDLIKLNKGIIFLMPSSHSLFITLLSFLKQNLL